MARATRVAIGLPVKDGDNFLADAIGSLLNQTYEDFTLVIGDNCSTDGTEEICRSAATEDKRVVYYRHEHDIGASANYTFVFERSSGSLFRWANHDDRWDSKHLETCVGALDEDPEAILACTGTVDIDADGATIKQWPLMSGYESADPATRLAEALSQEETFPIFGLIRRTALTRTQLQPPYAGSDRAMLAHLALLGRFVLIPEPLFLHRQHPNRSIRSARNREDRMNWWDPSGADRLVIPHVMLTRDYLRAIRSTPLTRTDRLRCLQVLSRDVLRRRRALTVDTIGATRFWVVRKLRLLRNSSS